MFPFSVAIDGALAHHLRLEEEIIYWKKMYRAAASERDVAQQERDTARCLMNSSKMSP